MEITIKTAYLSETTNSVDKLGGWGKGVSRILDDFAKSSGPAFLTLVGENGTIQLSKKDGLVVVSI